MIAWSWDSAQTLLAVLGPLVGVPLGVITFYLRSSHETQTSRHAELVRRFELIERFVGDLQETVSHFARDYATKEEWLRECMYARGRMERLAEAMSRLSATPLVSTVREDAKEDRIRPRPLGNLSP